MQYRHKSISTTHRTHISDYRFLHITSKLSLHGQNTLAQTTNRWSLSITYYRTHPSGPQFCQRDFFKSSIFAYKRPPLCERILACQIWQISHFPILSILSMTKPSTSHTRSLASTQQWLQTCFIRFLTILEGINAGTTVFYALDLRNLSDIVLLMQFDTEIITFYSTQMLTDILKSVNANLCTLFWNLIMNISFGIVTDYFYVLLCMFVNFHYQSIFIPCLC